LLGSVRIIHLPREEKLLVGEKKKAAYNLDAWGINESIPGRERERDFSPLHSMLSLGAASVCMCAFM
jgi:hypothetical protein